jgi:hypothetical protein
LNLLLTSSYLSRSVFADGAGQKVFEKQGGNGPFDVRFEKLANDTLEFWKVPGLSIAIVDGDDTWAAVSASLSFCLNTLDGEAGWNWGWGSSPRFERDTMHCI